MNKHRSLPMTYRPKLDAVFDGRCTQTIRLGSKYAVGDRLTIFEWSGAPYRSKWGRRLRVVLTTAYPVILFSDGIVYAHDIPISQEWGQADKLAADDGIDPPTGTELLRVLQRFHGPFTPSGVEAQILRWEASDD